MSKPAVALTEAEWSVIKAIWDCEPCTVPAIQEQLLKATGWTYATVPTFMDRMVAKGVLTAKQVGKLTSYRSAITREQAQRGKLRYALKHAFSGVLAPMVYWLLEHRDLDAEELTKIEALIQSRKQSARN